MMARLCLAAAILLLGATIATGARDLVERSSNMVEISVDKKKKDKLVPLELYTESTSEDSVWLLQRLDPVVALVHNLVDVKVHYIATGRGPQIVSRLGPEDVAGDIQQLCVSHYAKGKNAAYNTVWQFILCQGLSPKRIGDEEYANDCLAELEDLDPKDAADIKRCYSGPAWEGQGLLREDSEVTVAAGVDRSAAVYIDKKPFCTRNDGKWVRCTGGHHRADFADAICKAFHSLNGYWPVACDDASLEDLDADDDE